VQTRNCGDTPNDYKHLSERIDTYLSVDRLRTRLQDAIEGLSHYQFLFETDQKNLFVWPWKKANKDLANKYLNERDKESMFESIKRNRSLIENLRSTFL
jgi:hypothetical protein